VDQENIQYTVVAELLGLFAGRGGGRGDFGRQQGYEEVSDSLLDCGGAPNGTR
jgi:hypothetical protein